MIDAALFKLNRKNFMGAMEPGTLAVFNSNDIFPISADSTMPFQQHRDILFLSGVDQEESILVLFPNAKNPNQREVLFLKETSELIAIWEGEKLDKKRALEVSGISSVHWLQDFPTVFKQMMAEASGIYLNTNEHLRANTEVETREDRFIKKVKIEAYNKTIQFESIKVLSRWVKFIKLKKLIGNAKKEPIPVLKIISSNIHFLPLFLKLFLKVLFKKYDL